MDERDKTIEHLKKRDKKLREAIEQLKFQNKNKREHTQKSLHEIRVNLTSLKWTVHLLSDNIDPRGDERKEHLDAVKQRTAEALRMVEDLIRTLEDPD